MLVARVRAIIIFFALVTGACGSQEQRADAMATEARQAFASGDYSRARITIWNAISLRDDDAGYWIQLGRIDLALKDYGAAYAAYQRALELDRQNLEVFQTLAQLALVGKAYDQAEEYAEQAALLNPTDPSARLVTGYIALKKNDYDEALRLADEVLTTLPGNERAIDLKTKALVGKGDRAGAGRLIDQSIHAGGPTATKLTSLIEFCEAVVDGACLERAQAQLVRLQPRNWSAHLDYAKTLLRNDRRDQAVQQVAETLRLAPSEPRFPEQLVETLRTPTKARLRPQDLSSLAALASPAGRIAIAAVAIQQDDPNTAVSLTRAYAEAAVSNGTADAIAIFAQARYRLGDANTARGLADKILAFDKTHARALELRSELALREKDYVLALQDAQLLVKERPDLASARSLLARAYLGSGKRGLALLTYRKAYRDFPDNPVIRSEYRQITQGEQRSTADIEADAIVRS